MKKIILLLSLSFILVACESNVINETKETTSEVKETYIETTKESLEEDKTEIKESLFAESLLKNKEFSNVIASIDYLEDGSYQIRIRIEQKDDITFDTDNQNIYADIYISSQNLENNEILYEKNINDKTLYKIPLEDGTIPDITEILIDENSDLLTKKEHTAIKEKDSNLVMSVQIRDPQGYILEVSNVIFPDE